MKATPHYLTPLLAAGVVASVVAAPAAAAAPKCTSTTPTTTQCERGGGSTAIVTGPGSYADNAAFPFPEYPWGTGGIGGPILGKGGI